MASNLRQAGPQASADELAEILESLSGWLRWYLILSALVAVLIAIGAIGVAGQAIWRAAIPSVLWASLLLAARRVQTHYSVGAAVFVAAFPVLLASIALFVLPQQAPRDTYDSICGLLLALTLGLQGARCVVLVVRLRRAG